MYYGAYDCGATIIRIKVGDEVMTVMMVTVVVVLIMSEALPYVVLMIFRIRERVIDISSWLEVEHPGGPF